jgi:hypothetical protein
MGRWTRFKYRLKEGKALTIITAYRVCQQSKSAVNNSNQTAYKQQKLMLIEDKKAENTDPRKMFIIDMIKLINKIEKDDNNYVMLMLDANEGLCDKEGGVRKLTKETASVDTFSIFTGA